MTRRGRAAAAAMLVAMLLSGCGGADPDREPVAGVEADENPESASAPSGSERTGGCDALHTEVLAELARVAERADAALGDTGLEEIIVGLASPDVSLPAEVAFLEQLAPGRPYGGIAGAEAESRYDDLGCRPDDEYRALSSFLGVPADASDEQIRSVLEAEAPSAGDAVTLGLARRLLEGAATADDAAVLVTALEEAMAAQEAVRASSGSYTEDVSDLVDAGLSPTYEGVEGVFLLILAADEEQYCMTVAADRGVAYVESHDGVPLVESRPDPADWCADTFGELE